MWGDFIKDVHANNRVHELSIAMERGRIDSRSKPLRSQNTFGRLQFVWIRKWNKGQMNNVSQGSSLPSLPPLSPIHTPTINAYHRQLLWKGQIRTSKFVRPYCWDKQRWNAQMRHTLCNIPACGEIMCNFFVRQLLQKRERERERERKHVEPSMNLPANTAPSVGDLSRVGSRRYEVLALEWLCRYIHRCMVKQFGKIDYICTMYNVGHIKRKATHTNAANYDRTTRLLYSSWRKPHLVWRERKNIVQKERKKR